jgi:hypothetical protein
MKTNMIRKLMIAAVACSVLSMAASAMAQFTSGTEYSLVNVNSGLAVNVSGGGTTNSAKIIQWPYASGSANSQWSFVATDSGYYQIVSANSGKDIVVQGAYTTNGAHIIQYQFGSSQNDQWKPGKTSDGSYMFTNRHSGLILEVPGNSTAQGTQLDQWAHNGGANQRFTVTAVSGGGGTYTAAQVLSGVQSKMTSANQVNTKPHINTMTRAMNVNVYQVASGVFAYTSSMAIDDDGSDPDSDPDHQSETTWTDDSGNYLGAHHVAFYVLGDDCWDNEGGSHITPCPHFFYAEHNITGLQFALIFYNGKVIGSVFGDTQTANNQTTSDNDARELGEASVEAASELGIPSSGTTGGVDSGVTVVIFSGSKWVVKGANSTDLNNNAKAMIQTALNTLGPQVQ